MAKRRACFNIIYLLLSAQFLFIYFDSYKARPSLLLLIRSLPLHVICFLKTVLYCLIVRLYCLNGTFLVGYNVQMDVTVVITTTDIKC